MEYLVELAVLAAAQVVLALVGMLRVRDAHRRRRRSANRGETVLVPLRLRGTTLRYPGFWRSGLLNPATGVFKPRGGWGPRVELGGATQHSVGVGHQEADALPMFADGDVMVTYADVQGKVFQVAVVDERDAAFVSRRLRKAAAPRSDPASTPLRWLQHRVSMTVLTTMAMLVCLALYCVVPLLGAEQVTAEVVENRGPDYLCEVVWSGGHGYADCGDQQPGEHVDITVLGWPRTGTPDDPGGLVTAGVIGVLLALIPMTVVIRTSAAHRRKLRAVEGELARQAR